jgi:hypothetical protein
MYPSLNELASIGSCIGVSIEIKRPETAENDREILFPQGKFKGHTCDDITGTPAVADSAVVQVTTSETLTHCHIQT